MEGDGLRRSLLSLTVDKHLHPAYFQEKTYFQEKNNFHELLYCTLLNRIVGFEY